jgi:hypothetical protein
MEQSQATNANGTGYSGYRGLPPLVGMHTMEEAAAKGLSVEQSVARLKRLHWSLKRLHGILVSRIASIPVYELKMAFSLHAYYCADHAANLAARVREMREPPYRLDEPPHKMLDLFFDEIAAAPEIESLVTGLYAYAFPAVAEAAAQLRDATNRLLDHQTFRVCRMACVELQDVLDYGKEALLVLAPGHAAGQLGDWSGCLERCLAAAGGLSGTGPFATEAVAPVYSTTPRRYDGMVQRDERFKDPYNMGVNAEAMLFDPTIDALPKTLMLYFKRMREIDVPEMMSSILAETKDKPWEYYRDMSRQMWDEARHAMMGELGFVALGIDWRQIPFNFTWSLNLNTMLTPLERHAVLFTIEQGLMPRKNGKEHEWQIAIESRSPLSALIQDYDWADEIVHARIGRQWLTEDLGSQAKALEFGDKVWSKALTDWGKWREDGLTQHENWWPEIYRQACSKWGVAPDPEILAYNKTYENTRADLKPVVAEAVGAASA